MGTSRVGAREIMMMLPWRSCCSPCICEVELVIMSIETVAERLIVVVGFRLEPIDGHELGEGRALSLAA